MIATEIVNQVAQIMRQKAMLKDEKNPDALKNVAVQKDEVELTSRAAAYTSSEPNVPGYEKDQVMKVERLKSLVSTGNYKLDDNMVQEIASRIAKMFM